MYEYRCNERLKSKTEESTRLADTGLVVELTWGFPKKRQIIKTSSNPFFFVLPKFFRLYTTARRIPGREEVEKNNLIERAILATEAKSKGKRKRRISNVTRGAAGF
jgi:hypothetical protein